MNTVVDPASVVMDLPRRDALDKLTGRTRYTIDNIGPDMLHAVMVRSDVASARIIGIDASRALAIKGVRAIVTYQDTPGLHGIGIADHPLFAHDTIRYHGEPLAAIAADTLEIARAAAAMVDVELEPLPVLLTMAEALAEGAPLIHPDWQRYEVLKEGAPRGGNVAWEARVVRGDTDAAFARPDVTVVDDCFRVGRQSHVPFEPRCAIARYEDGRFHIQCSTQVPWTVRNVTAKVLGVASSRVRVTVPAVGGGFGLKFDCTIEPVAAILARKTGKTVSLYNSREEEFLSCLCRENAEVRIRSAVTADGEIVGREATVLMDCGAYGGEQIFLSTMTAHTLGGNYKLGSVKLNSRAVYTNTPPNGAFRACNGVYNTFFLERHTDNICAALGMNPMEFRKRQVLGHGDIGATGQVFEGDVLRPMLETMEAACAAGPSREAEAGKRLYGRATTVGTWFVFVGPLCGDDQSQCGWQCHAGHVRRRDRVRHHGPVAAADRGRNDRHPPVGRDRQDGGYRRPPGAISVLAAVAPRSRSVRPARWRRRRSANRSSISHRKCCRPRRIASRSKADASRSPALPAAA